MDLKKLIDDFRNEELINEISFATNRVSSNLDKFRKLNKDCFEFATLSEYMTWLKGYLLSGNNLSHSYNYNFPTNSFMIAKKDLILLPLFGADSLNIIIPENISYNSEYGMGHSSLYFMKDFSIIGFPFIPLYNDINF